MPMLSDAQPPVPPAVADQPRPARPKRLAGLWIICVYMGLVSMVGLAFAFAMPPVWAFVYGGLAVLCLAVAVALWLRLRPAWYVAIALLGIGTAWGVLSDLLSGHPHLAGLPIGCGLYLAIALYLWKRRGYFGQSDANRPRLISVPGIFALAIVLVFGGGFLLLMTVDDPRQSFPELQVQVPVPPEQENGFLLVEQMRAKWPLEDDDQLNEVADGLPKGEEGPSAQWVEDARGLAQRYAGCLADARELLKKPHFVEVPQLTGIARASRLMPWLGFTRRLSELFAVSAEVQVADHHWNQALDEADRAVELSVLVSKESTSLIQALVAHAVAMIGLRRLRNVAAVVPNAALLKAHLGPPLPEEQFGRGFNLGLAGEFQGDVGLFEDLRRGGYEAVEALMGTERPRASRRGFFGRHTRVIPLIKKNMTRNLFGRLVQPYIIQGDTYAPPPQNRFLQATDLESTARSVGYLQFARNPVGDMLIVILLPALQRSVRVHFETIAEGRLTQTFIALRCYQLEHGKLPETLDALAPEYLKTIPLDPFTGKPFGYEPRGEEPRIWSVGPDQKTDPPDVKNGDDVVVPISFAAVKR